MAPIQTGFITSCLLALALGATSCASPLPVSRFAFDSYPPDGAGMIDVAWFAVADASSKTFGELAMLNLAARQIQFEVYFGAPDSEPSLGPGMIKVPYRDCIADSPLLIVFAGICSNILGRNEIDAADKAAERLRPLCH
jgi:hypothetical protein